MTRNLHSIEFQEQSLIKVRERGTRSVQDVANDLNMPVGTLRKWISKSNRKTETASSVVQLPDDLPALSWGSSQRLQALHETHALDQTLELEYHAPPRQFERRGSGDCRGLSRAKRQCVRQSLEDLDASFQRCGNLPPRKLSGLEEVS